MEWRGWGKEGFRMLETQPFMGHGNEMDFRFFVWIGLAQFPLTTAETFQICGDIRNGDTRSRWLPAYRPYGESAIAIGGADLDYKYLRETKPKSKM